MIIDMRIYIYIYNNTWLLQDNRFNLEHNEHN